MAKRPPKYTLHKPTGQARVRINGKSHYLGEHGSPDSHRRYDALIAKWLGGTFAGAVPVHRNPPNGYRLFRRSDLVKFLYKTAKPVKPR